MALPTKKLQAHPRGQVTMNGGLLYQARMARFSLTNNGKLTHTLAKSPAGYELGPEECEGSLEIILPETGPEADWVSLLKKGQAVAFGFEMPALQHEVEGILTRIEGELSVEKAVQLTVSWTGAISESVI